jgi:DNA-binding winged helix-turn-helix (wHTH) protein
MPRYTFGPFLLDPEARVLLREGEPMPMPAKAFDTLLLLVENRGRLIDKDELLSVVWAGSVVEEANLTQTIFTIRKVLGDSSKDRRYIATIAGRGYQFVAPVTGYTSTVPTAHKAFEESVGAGHSDAPASLPQAAAGRRRWPLALGGPLALIALAGLVWFPLHRSSPPRPEPKPRRLTANPAGNPVTDAHISPDGKYLAYADRAGIQLQLIDTGETRTIPRPQHLGEEVTGWSPVGWFPDGTKLLAQATSLDAEYSGVWLISMLGGAPHEIHEGGFAWSVSPDGSLIAFTPTFFHSDIWLMGANGDNPRKIVTANEGESLNWVVWSPDSRRIAYERFHFGPAWAGAGLSTAQGVRSDIEIRDLKGGQPVVVLSVPKLPTGGFEGGFSWLSDGRLIYSHREAAPGLGSPETNL